MANKSNIRSIRFSDEMAELIDRQIGDTFTQKFENLITRCVWELPAKEKELAEIQQRIESRRKELSRLQEAIQELRWFDERIKNAKRAFEQVEASAKHIAEKCNTD